LSHRSATPPFHLSPETKEATLPLSKVCLFPPLFREGRKTSLPSPAFFDVPAYLDEFFPPLLLAPPFPPNQLRAVHAVAIPNTYCYSPLATFEHPRNPTPIFYTRSGFISPCLFYATKVPPHFPLYRPPSQEGSSIRASLPPFLLSCFSRGLDLPAIQATQSSPLTSFWQLANTGLLLRFLLSPPRHRPPVSLPGLCSHACWGRPPFPFLTS